MSDRRPSNRSNRNLRFIRRDPSIRNEDGETFDQFRDNIGLNGADQELLAANQFFESHRRRQMNEDTERLQRQRDYRRNSRQNDRGLRNPPELVPFAPPAFESDDYDDDGEIMLPQSVQDMIDFIENNRYELDNGRVYIVEVNGTYYTLNATNYMQLLRILRGEITDVEEDGSDEGILTALINQPFPDMNGRFFRVDVFQPRDTPSRNRMNPSNHRGAMFPYIHNLGDYEELDGILSELGIYSKVTSDNYKDNCLIQSIRHLLPDDESTQTILQDLCLMVKSQIVPTKKLTEIGNKYDLRFIVHKFDVTNRKSSSNIGRYGPKEGIEVNLCLVDQHYFPFIKHTGATSFGLEHYEQNHQRRPNDWWKIKGNGAVEKKGGINSLNLVKKLIELKETFLRRIDIGDSEILKTVYGSRLIDGPIGTLDYTDDCVKPAIAPKQEGEENNRKIPAIAKTRRHLASLGDMGERTIKNIERRIEKYNMGLDEQMREWRTNNLSTAIAFFDVETVTDGDSHEAWMVCWGYHDEDEVFSAYGSNCMEIMCERIMYDWPQMEPDEVINITLIAHNVTYDLSFLIANLNQLSTLKRGTSVISAEGSFNHIRFSFRDSYKIIPAPLRNFKSMFDLDVKKEVLCYEMYTRSNMRLYDFLVKESDILKTYPETGESLLKEMKEAASEWEDCFFEIEGIPMVDLKKYGMKYCELDIRVLREGFRKFNEMTMEHFDVDTYTEGVRTVAGIASTVLYRECLSSKDGSDEVYLVSGVPMEFMKRCTVGGQTQTANNEKFDVIGEMVYQDVNSLYPYAISTFTGILMGKPIPYVGQVPSDVDYFFAEIKVTSTVLKQYDFAVVCKRTKANGNDWTNDICGSTLYVDKTTLQDLMFYYGDDFKYEMIRGYYYNQGFNREICSLMKNIYSKRLQLKKEKNPAQLIFKLMMNSMYGRAGMKPPQSKELYFDDEYKLNRFIFNNHNSIKQMYKMANGEVCVQISELLCKHFNLQHLACMVLSQAKSIMRRYLCSQQRLSTPLSGQMYYTDTDSILWGKQSYNEFLGLEMFREANIEGKNLGQLSSDFEQEECFYTEDGVIKKASDLPYELHDLRAKYAIVLGKKANFMVLYSPAKPDQEIYRIRLKGITEKAILNKCQSEYNGDMRAMYSDLLHGKVLSFTLEGLFKVEHTGRIYTTSMIRKVKFPGSLKSIELLD